MDEQTPSGTSPSATPTPAQPPVVLVVDDEQNVLRAIKRALRNMPWQVVLANSGAEAVGCMEKTPAEVVISDYRMPGITGVELLRTIKERWPDTQRIMFTGQSEQKAIQQAINRSEIFRFITKPWDDSDLIAVITSALEAVHLTRENRRLLQLTLQKNEELAQLNVSLEEKVRERTALLSRSKREWEAAFDALTTPFAIINRSNKVHRANLAWANAGNIPVTDVLKQPCYQARFGRDAPCPACPLAETLSGNKPVERELVVGERRVVVSAFPWLDASGLPESEEHWAVVTYRDVTDERKQADWRMRTERLAAVGRLAGGVAHEINNPLSGVLAFAQLMLKDAASRNADDQEALKLIEESALRCKHIVESLLRFAGSPGESSRQPTDLRRITTDTLVLFRAQLKSRPKVRLEFEANPPTLPTLLADPHALGQALMDFLNHRMRALLPEGGRLSLGFFFEGEKIGWRLHDSAPVLTSAQVEKLADPEVSDGTGLGIAFRIIREHQGRVDVNPHAEGGNVFTLHVGNLLERT
jgi:C4-dicarboxylate-specific signal transduction histidine kinase